MDFPTDKKGWDIKNQFMFGRSILVAPVVEAKYTPEKIVQVNKSTVWDKQGDKKNTEKITVDFIAEKSKNVCLQAGIHWYDFWTNEKIKEVREL
ncbi:MAG: hypothetical protein ABI554_09610 [Flavobacterium sp.]